MGNSPIRIAILSPSVAVRVGLQTLISVNDDFEIVSEVTDFDELKDHPASIDVVIMQDDSYLDEWSPPTGRESQFAILWVVDDPQAAQILRGLPVRSWGIVSTEANAIELASACKAINQGLITAPARILSPLWVEVPTKESNSLIEELTPRETEVLQWLAQGFPNKQIAQALTISEHTVKFHISSIYTKLGVTNRTEAVRTGLQLGLIAL